MPEKKKNDFLIPLLTVLVDIVAIEISFLLSYWLRFHSVIAEYIPITLGIPPLMAYVEGSLIVIPIWLLLFHSRHLYQPRRVISFSDEFFAIIRLVMIGLIVVMAVAFFYREFSYSRIVFGILGLSSIICISIGRFSILKFEQWWYSKGHDLKQVIIVGTSSAAQKIIRSIPQNKILGFELIGYCTYSGTPEPLMGEARCLGSISTVPELVKKQHIDIAFIAPNETERLLVHNLILDCQGLNTEMMMVPDVVELLTSQVNVKHIEGIPFLGIKSPSLSTWNVIIKRSFDFMFSLIVLLIISPFFLIIAILVKLNSIGPVFYLQERIGLDGKVFRVIKFRSMRLDAENTTGPIWSQKNDPRATSFGRFMRRFSIDELPQLINVIKGDMSVVGPRPERPHFVEQFKREVPRYLERHRVKTGMTGWAQVNGLRGSDASITERTKYDIYYVENWSLVFDLKIILKTLHTVLFGEGAH